MGIKRARKKYGRRCFALAAVLAVAGCKAALDPSATATSYVRLLDADPPTNLACMRATSNGNLLFLFTAQPTGVSATRIELTETDPNGNVLWTRIFGDSGAYQAGDCLPLGDGTIAVAGSHALNTKFNALDFFHLAADGNPIVSTEQLPVLGLQAATIQTDDSGGYVIGCSAKDPLTNNNPAEVLTVRLSGQGAFVDSSVRSPGANTSSNTPYAFGISAMCAVANRVAFAAGYAHNSGAQFPSPAIFEWNEPDSIFKSSEFSGAGEFRSIVRASATACVIAGDVALYGKANGNAWVGKLDPAAWNGSGNPPLTWADTAQFGVASTMVSVTQTADGGYASTGYGVSKSGDTSLAVFRFDADGKNVWPYKTYDFSGGDVPSNIIELPNQDLVVGGVTTSFGKRASGARQIFLIHLKPDGTPAS